MQSVALNLPDLFLGLLSYHCIALLYDIVQRKFQPMAYTDHSTALELTVQSYTVIG